MDAVLDTVNPLISVNVKSIDTSYLSYGTNYFYVTANATGELLLAISLKNAPTIVGANSNTNVYIGYDVQEETLPIMMEHWELVEVWLETVQETQ